MDNNLSQIQNDETVEQNIASEETVTESLTSDTTPDLSLPLEEIKAEGTYEERLEHRLHVLKPLMWLLFVFGALCCVLGIMDSIETKVFSAFFVAAAFLILVALMSRSGTKTVVKEDMKKGGYFIYRVFYNRIEYGYYIGDDLYTFYRVDPAKITKAKLLRHTLVFAHEGILFMVPKASITNDSFIYKAVMSSKKSKAKKGSDRPCDKRQTAIIWLLFSSAVIFAATITVSMLAPIAAMPFAIISFFCIGLPIVALALIKGWQSKGKGLIIAASIILIIALFASFIVGAETSADYNNAQFNEKLDVISEKTGIDIPDIIEGYEYEESVYDESTKAYLSYTYIGGFFSDEDNERFKATVEKNDMWITSMDEELEYFIGSICPSDGDPFIIVNITEGTYNQLPTTNYDCEYVIISYDYTYASITIYTFTKSYTGSIPSTPGSLLA